MTWIQRHIDPVERLWAVVLAGHCPWVDTGECSYADDDAHAHMLRDDGRLGISTSSLALLGVKST